MMTADEFTARLPDLTNNPLPIKPPFVFNHLSSRVFPLRAHLGTLQRVCDGYLNFVPPEAGYFRVPMPYVYVMVLDYGQVTEAVARIGWFAQTEVFFMIPLEWYKFVGGQWVFHDWAVITPYVFVNDDFSVPLGRTVFGFPKVQARVMQSSSAWIRDATAPVTLARVETGVFPKTYAGAELQDRVLLEVERNTMSNLRVPFDVAGAATPWSMASNIAKAAAGFSRDAMWLAQSMRLSPLNPVDPGVMQAMVTRMAPWFAPGGSGFIQNSINLKQFRRSDDPSQVCYQALTNGKMEVRSFNGAGLLGEYEVMLGDLSGGHTVRLYEYASLPLVSTLGLEVEREWQGPDCRVTELKPVVPYWLDVDIKYDQGDNVAWRLDDGIWRDGSGAVFPSQPKPKGADAPAFNSTVTTVIDDIAGPFDFSDSVVRVLPLLADMSKLQKFVDTYLNDAFKDKDKHGVEQHLRFDVWGRVPEQVNEDTAPGDELAYVYLMVSSFGDVISSTNNVGDWTNYQLSFMIPVHFKRKTARGDWELLGVGLVPAFSFVDNCVAAIARLEVQGFEAIVANFMKPASAWLSDQVELNDNPQQTLLRVDTEVWPAFGQGQKATVQPILEICQGEPDAGLGTAPDAPWQWAETLRGELLAKKRIKDSQYQDLKIARALALELLGNQMPFTAYSLKQFRDSRDPSKACYQSLVRVPRQIKQLQDLREIEDTLVVRIHNFPSLDIVGELGLVAAGLPTSGEGIISTAQAIRPFFIRGTLHEPLAIRLGFRAGGERWQWDSESAFATLLSDAEGATPITADLRAETLQDQIDPSRIAAVVYQAGQRRKMNVNDPKEPDQAPIAKEEARAALMAIDPQTVIECILSREWGNRDIHTRWRKGRRKLEDALAALPLISETEAYPESVLYRKANNDLADTPGAVASPMNISETYFDSDDALAAAIAALNKEQPTTAAKRWANTLDKIILNQERFMRWRLQMEEALSKVSAMTILKPAGVAHFYQAKLNQTAPGSLNLITEGLLLMGALLAISELEIEGEPSDRNNLDTQVLADKARLAEILNGLKQSASDEESDGPDARSQEQVLEWALEHAGEFRQAVDLARSYCGAQNQAFLNKLSRAFQKPDFCIRRDVVGSSCDQLLPLSLSWDEDWYYGRNVTDTPLAWPPLSSATGAVISHPLPDAVPDPAAETEN
ncbi:MAG TPA: hypothetical protein VGL22_04835 [Terracidiphilus sp.]